MFKAIFVQGNGRIYKECAFQVGPPPNPSERNPLRTEDVRDQSHNMAVRIFWRHHSAAMKGGKDLADPQSQSRLNYRNCWNSLGFPSYSNHSRRDETLNQKLFKEESTRSLLQLRCGGRSEWRQAPRPKSLVQSSVPWPLYAAGEAGAVRSCSWSCFRRCWGSSKQVHYCGLLLLLPWLQTRQEADGHVTAAVRSKFRSVRNEVANDLLHSTRNLSIINSTSSRGMAEDGCDRVRRGRRKIYRQQR